MPALIPLGFWAASGTGGGGAGAAAYELISTTVLGTAAASVTFSGLGTSAAAYKHLQLRITSRTTQAVPDSNISLNFNGDSSSLYWGHLLYGNGSSALSSANTSLQTSLTIGEAVGNTGTANAFSSTIAEILDFASSSKNKTVRSLTGFSQSANSIVLRSGTWTSTAAVTSITISGYGGSNLVTGSRFSLYGLR